MSEPIEAGVVGDAVTQNTNAPATTGDAGAPPQGGPRGPRGPRGGAPGGFPGQNHAGKNLYIKNLDETVGDNELKAAFEKFGEISSAKVMMDDKSPPQSRGFGFVCFKELPAATRAIAEMNGHVLGTKPLYVNVAQRKDQRQQALATHFNQAPPFAGSVPGMGAMPGMPVGMPPYGGVPGYAPQMNPGFGFGGFGGPARGGVPQRGWPVPGMPNQMPMFAGQWGAGPVPGPRGAPPRGQ